MRYLKLFITTALLALLFTAAAVAAGAVVLVAEALTVSVACTISPAAVVSSPPLSSSAASSPATTRGPEVFWFFLPRVLKNSATSTISSARIATLSVMISAVFIFFRFVCSLF